MHPLLARPRQMAAVLLSAAAVSMPLASVLRLLDGRPWPAAFAFATPMLVCFAFVALSAYWVCRRHPLDDTGPLSAVRPALLWATSAGALWAVLGTVWATLLRRWAWPSATPRAVLTDAAILFALGVVLYLLSVVVHYLVDASEASHEAERRSLEFEVGAREAELRALRAQLNPHFLFNSLNSINALIGSDNEGARRMCELLGDFLRRTLALGEQELVPLCDELELIERYLGIEQVRFGERLKVERSVDREAERCLVPPLLLQPLVENAIKHGIADCVEGGTLRLTVQRADGLLRLTVDNPVDDHALTHAGEGLGLQNVRRRLAALSDVQTRLHTDRSGGRFHVTLILPAQERDKVDD